MSRRELCRDSVDPRIFLGVDRLSTVSSGRLVPIIDLLRLGRGFFVLKVSERIRSTHNQDGAVVLDVRQGQMFQLNLVGSRMLELLKQGFSQEQIAGQISREFSVAPEIVEADLREFLVHLERHRLLEQGKAEARVAP